MNLTIKENKENKALSRIEVVAEVIFDKATPNRKEVQKAIAKAVKGNEKLTIVSRIKTHFGNSKATVEALVYNDEAVMIKIERKNLIAKHVVEAPKKEEAPKVEAKVEEKTEASVEEAKAEKPVEEPAKEAE